MVPNSASPPPPGRPALRPSTETELRAVIAERWRSHVGTEAALTRVIGRLAEDARADGLRPEELIIALKAVEEEVLGAPGTLRAGDQEARRRFREWLVKSCITAYFGQ